MVVNDKHRVADWMLLSHLAEQRQLHENIDTFPHHKHKDGKILPSNEIGIVEVFGYIFSFLERNDLS